MDKKTYCCDCRFIYKNNLHNEYYCEFKSIPDYVGKGKYYLSVSFSDVEKNKNYDCLFYKKREIEKEKKSKVNFFNKIKDFLR